MHYSIKQPLTPKHRVASAKNKAMLRDLVKLMSAMASFMASGPSWQQGEGWWCSWR